MDGSVAVENASTDFNHVNLASKEEEILLQLENIGKKEWFYRDISHDQIELVFKTSASSNVFLVTNAPLDGNYMLYMRSKQPLAGPDSEIKLEKVELNMHQKEDGFLYKFSNQSDEFSGPVEAIQLFVSNGDCKSMPAVPPHVTYRQESIQSNTSNDVDIPPNYTAAATFPSATQKLPEVITKVDVKKGEDADMQEAPIDSYNHNYGDVGRSDQRDMRRWRTHFLYYRNLCCCHPKNVWHCCCHRGYRSPHGRPRKWYDVRGGAGCCRGICLLLMYCCLCVLLPCWGPCAGAFFCLLCFAQRYNDDD